MSRLLLLRLPLNSLGRLQTATALGDLGWRAELLLLANQEVLRLDLTLVDKELWQRRDEALFDELDLDGDGYISRREWDQAFRTPPPVPQ